MSLEIWKEIEGFPNYEISNLGKVKSKARIVCRGHLMCSLKEIIKVPKLEKSGYYTIQLFYAPKKAKTKYLHRLLGQAFIPLQIGKDHINHKNGIKTDNALDNLEWCTRSENSIHAFNIGLMIPQKGSDHYSTNLSDKDVIKIRELFDNGIKAKEIAKRFYISRRNVNSITNRHTWKHI